MSDRPLISLARLLLSGAPALATLAVLSSPASGKEPEKKPLKVCDIDLNWDKTKVHIVASSPENFIATFDNGDGRPFKIIQIATKKGEADVRLEIDYDKYPELKGNQRVATFIFIGVELREEAIDRCFGRRHIPWPNGTPPAPRHGLAP